MFPRSRLISWSLMAATAGLWSWPLCSSSGQEDVVGTVPTGTLHNGVVVPLVGLGCASGVRGEHVSSALSIGYRYFDTAQSYSWGYREDEVGDAVQRFMNAAGNNNEEDDPIFVQTKIHPQDLGYVATKKAVSKSLDRLKVKTLDSVLIHKPHCWEGICAKEPEGTWQDSWKALEELYEGGTITKSIGICDVSSPALLDELLSQKIKPHVIQNWMDPLHQDKAMRRRIQEHGILYQAYSSLGTQWFHHKGHKKNPVTNHPTLLRIANAHGADVGQVVVNWATTRHGISILPASTNPVRQEGNLRSSFRFVLTEDELDQIDALDGKVPKKVRGGTKNDGEVSIRFEHQDGADDTQKPIIDVYWLDREETEVHVGTVKAGQGLSITSYHGHTFRFRDPSDTTNSYRDHTVEQKEGKQQVHLIAQEDDEEL